VGIVDGTEGRIDYLEALDLDEPLDVFSMKLIETILGLTKTPLPKKASLQKVIAAGARKKTLRVSIPAEMDSDLDKSSDSIDPYSSNSSARSDVSSADSAQPKAGRAIKRFFGDIMKELPGGRICTVEEQLEHTLPILLRFGNVSAPADLKKV